MRATRKKRWPWVLGIILAVLVVAGALALSRVDAILNEQAAAQAVKASEMIGRPVRIGDVSLKLLTGLAVRVSDVHVDPLSDEGADAPPLHMDRLDVRVGLLRALFSLGKDVVVKNAEVTGLTVNVVKLKDGTTNLERIQAKLNQQPQAPPKAEEEPTDLSFVRVDRAALVDGKVRLIDRSVPQARELAVSDIDLLVEDLRVGQPLEIVLKAAVLAQAQNFEFRVKAAPLPKTLIPTPDELSLKLQPLDLKPLAPFIPKSVGLLGGNVRADLVAKLGAAVPDGKGPTTVKGDVKAAGLVFAGAEGGRALDVSLDTDVKADAVKGDLQLDVLTLRAGSAAIIGKGRASGLLSSSPKVEGLEVRGQDLDLSKLAAYYPPLTKMLGAQVEGPIGLLLTAAGDSGAQALKLELDFTPVRLMVPAQLSKAAGAPMTLTARAQASGDKAIAFNATMNLSGADLRPGLVLNKPPGAKTDFALSGTYRNEPTRVDIPSFTAHLLEDTVEGRATAEMKPKSTTFDVAVKSARLNADALLLETEEPAAGSKAPAPPPPAEDPSRFDGMRGKVRAEIASLRMQKSDFAQVLAQLSMVNDALTVDSFTTQAFGGKIDASGSSIKLGPVQRPFVAKLQMRSIDMGAAAGMASTKKMVGGTFNGDINLEGAGTEMESLSQTLAGNLDGKMLNAVLPGTDLLAEVTQPLAKALPFGGSALKSPGGSTSLGKEIDLGLTIQKGVALLKKPIKVDRPEMGLELAGGMRLTGDLDLGGALSLSPQTISAVTRGKATPKEAIPVALKITGPIWKPVVSGLDLKPALKSIASQAMGGLAERFLGDKAKAVTGVTDNAQQVAQQRAAEEKGKAEAAAREEAEKAKKRAADEAKKGLKGIFGR